MAQPKRIEEVPRYWRYKGQPKIHSCPHFVALVPDAADEAHAANEAAGYLDALAEYNGACETGTAVVVLDPGAGA